MALAANDAGRADVDELAELVVVEGPAGQRQPAELLLHPGDEPGCRCPKFSAV